MSDIIEVTIDQIEIADNVRGRMDEEALEALGQSIATVGQLSPVTVNSNGGDVVRLVMGHRRVEAVRMAIEDGVLPGDFKIRAEVNNASKDNQDVRLAHQLVENLQREDLDPIEEAEGYAQLKAQGRKQKEIAEMVSRSGGHVSKRLSLLRLDPDTQDLIRHGEIPIEVAIELPGLPQETVTRLRDRGQRLTVREVKTAQAAVKSEKAIQKIVAELEKKKIKVASSRFVAHDECPDGQRVVWHDEVEKVADLPKRLKGVVVDTFGQVPKLTAYGFRKPTADEIAEQTADDAETAAHKAARDERDAHATAMERQFVDNPPATGDLMSMLASLVRYPDIETSDPLTQADVRSLIARFTLEVFQQVVASPRLDFGVADFEYLMGLWAELGSVPLPAYQTNRFLAGLQRAINEENATNEEEDTGGDAEGDQVDDD